MLKTRFIPTVREISNACDSIQHEWNTNQRGRRRQEAETRQRNLIRLLARARRCVEPQ
jgi:hypothetical protein